jgi:hypothetical protein
MCVDFFEKPKRRGDVLRWEWRSCMYWIENYERGRHGVLVLFEVQWTDNYGWCAKSNPGPIDVLFSPCSSNTPEHSLMVFVDFSNSSNETMMFHAGMEKMDTLNRNFRRMTACFSASVQIAAAMAV